MSLPRTLADARAQCRAAGVDLRVSGRGLNACMDLLLPFCPDGVTSDGPDGLPACAGDNLSPVKAAILLREAEARAAANAGPQWVLIGSGVLAAGLLAYALTR